MPINIMQGTTANFVVEFLDSVGNPTVPSSGNLVVTYTALNGTTAASSIALVLGQTGVFTGSWGSSVALAGLANWSVTAPGSAFTPAASGVLRIIDG